MSKCNLEQRTCLLLEDLCFDSGRKENLSEYEKKDAFDFLAELFSNLEEKDLLSGLWRKNAKFLETRHGIMFEQEGNFLKAKENYENAIKKFELNKFLPFDCKSEYNLWKSHWEKCSRQLGDWMIDLYNPETHEQMHSLGFLNKAWQIPYLEPITELLLMKLEQKVCLDGLKPDYRTLTSTCSYLLPKEALNCNISQVEMETLNNCIGRWRLLPEVMTEKHKLLLKAAQYLQELEISTTVLDEFTAMQQRSCSKEVLSEDVIRKLKAVPSRLTSYAAAANEDALLFANVMGLQEKTYQNICLIAAEDKTRSFAENQSVQAFRALAANYAHQCALKSAKFSRECGQSNLCQTILKKLEAFAINMDIPLWQEIIMQMKELLLGMAPHTKQSKHFIQEAFHSFCHVKYSPVLETGDSGLDSSPLELNKTSIHWEYNNYSGSNEAGMVWAEFLLQLFTEKNKEKYSQTQWQEWGTFAIKFFLQSCTLGYQSESFVPISKVLWLLSYDNEEGIFASVIGDYGLQIPAKHWVLWIPQLLSALFSKNPHFISKILFHIVQKYPQDVFFQMRSFILELHAECTKRGNEATIRNGIMALQACTMVFKKIRMTTPNLFFSLNKIAEQLELLKGSVYEHILKLLKKVRKICYNFAFQKIRKESESSVPSEISDNIKTVLMLFMSEKIKENNPSSGLQKGKETSLEYNSFNTIKSKFCSDFNNYDSENCDLEVTLRKVNQYILMLSDLSKVRKRHFNLHDKSEYLCSLRYQRDDLKMLAKSPLEEYETVHIARFLPKVELVQKYDVIARRLYIEGDNGKIYQYLLLFNEEAEEQRKRDRILKLQQVMNCLFPKIKNTAKKFLKFMIREATFLHARTCLMCEDDSTISIFDIFEKHCSDIGIKSSAPLDNYYEGIQMLNGAEFKNSPALKSIFTSIQNDFVPQKLLKDWVHHLFSCASDYWEFRKQFTHHVALLGSIEYVFELSPQTPDLMYMQRSSGKMYFWNFQFLHGDEDGRADASKNVPFRLTPNICNFITPSGVLGTFGGTFLSIAECLKTEWRKIEYVIKILLMEELLALNRKKTFKLEPSKMGIFIPKVETFVCNAYDKIESLSCSEHHVEMWRLISSAESFDNLSLIDPTAYPWL